MARDMRCILLRFVHFLLSLSDLPLVVLHELTNAWLRFLIRSLIFQLAVIEVQHAAAIALEMLPFFD